MKILELFSGYGTSSFALKRLGISYEIVGYSDIDKYANQCFQQNHGGKQLGDVKLINPSDLEDFDLLTGGFPCQSFSNAGKGLGESDPRGTLFYEIIRIAEVKQPKYMLLENVKGLTCKKFKDTFDKILSELDRIGYNVYWKVLTSKDYGIPQSRQRVWFVCFRKDIDKKDFQFPQPVELKIFIKDILEPEVDRKYYLSPLLQERFKEYIEEKKQKVEEETPAILDLYNREVRKDGICIALSNPNHCNLRLIEGNLKKSNNSQYDTNMSIPEIGEAHRIYGVNGICPPIKQSGINIKDNLVYDRKGFDSRTKGFRESELSPTLSTKMGTGGNNVPMVMNCIGTCFGRRGTSQEEMDMYNKVHKNSGMIRRLTPKECFRLMGFLNDEINLEGLSDTQRYKLAGNGQDVNVVSLIFKEMFKQ
jgi:DNA (cytosine-5)-methyltransferase 1